MYFYPFSDKKVEKNTPPKTPRDAFKKKKIAYNETLSYLGVGGVKKIPTILHLRNGTFFYGRGGQNYMFYVTSIVIGFSRLDVFCGIALLPASPAACTVTCLS